LAEQAQKRVAALEAERAQHTGKLSELEKAEKARKALEQERTRNPSKYLEALFGADWYDTATKLKTGTVTPGAVGAQLSEAEQRFEAKLKEQGERFEAEIGRLRQAEEDRAREDLYRAAGDFAKANAEKFPLTNKYEKSADVGALIEGHFKATSKRNPDGSWEPGEMWTQEQGAAEMEKYWSGIRDMVMKAETGRAPERPEARLTIIPEKGDGTTPPDQLTDEQRYQRTRAAFEAEMAKRRQARA